MLFVERAGWAPLRSIRQFCGSWCVRTPTIPSMQGVIIAAISAVAGIVPSLIAAGSLRGRILRRIKSELEAYAAIPAELTQERQLVRYTLNQTVWAYALACRPHPSMLLASLIMAASAFTSMYSLSVAFPSFDDEPSFDGHDAIARIAALVLGLIMALWYFYMAISHFNVDKMMRVARLDGPPDYDRQLLAVEARNLAPDASLDDVELGRPEQSGSLVVAFVKRVFTSWDPVLDIPARHATAPASPDDQPILHGDVDEAPKHRPPCDRPTDARQISDD